MGARAYATARTGRAAEWAAAPARYGPDVAASRIELEPEEVAGLIRGSRLLELRPDTPADVRRRSIDTALTAMDALCGLADRGGTDAVWDALELLTHRELLAFATLMASELAETNFALPAFDAQGPAPEPPAAP
jgi:hypothetical protein